MTEPPRQIAEVLVSSVTSSAAERKTFELVAEQGSTDDLEALFAALKPDPSGTLDAVLDGPNMPFDGQPQQVRDDLAAVAGR
jgi:hypothetical protein